MKSPISFINKNDWEQNLHKIITAATDYLIQKHSLPSSNIQLYFTNESKIITTQMDEHTINYELYAHIKIYNKNNARSLYLLHEFYNIPSMMKASDIDIDHINIVFSIIPLIRSIGSIYSTNYLLKTFNIDIDTLSLYTDAINNIMKIIFNKPNKTYYDFIYLSNIEFLRQTANIFVYQNFYDTWEHLVNNGYIKSQKVPQYKIQYNT